MKDQNHSTDAHLSVVPQEDQPPPAGRVSSPMQQPPFDGGRKLKRGQFLAGKRSSGPVIKHGLALMGKLPPVWIVLALLISVTLIRPALMALAADVQPVSSFESGWDGWTPADGGDGTIERSQSADHDGSWGVRATSDSWGSGSHTLQKTISTVGYRNIHVIYWRDGYSLEGNDDFTAQWHDGSDWRTMETIGDADDGWTRREWDLSGDSTANDNANFTVRFTFNGRRDGGGDNDYFYLDDILITGDLVGYGTIGNFVWIDSNGNGTRDAGENTGLSGVQVTLSGPESGTRTSSGATEPNYNFTALPAGNYTVSVPATSGNYYLSTANNLNRNLPTNNSTVADADFGFAPYSTITGRVWYDINRNGTLDGGESGIANIDVRLYDDTNHNGAYNSGEPLRDTVSTDSSGSYTFGDLRAQSWYVIDVVESDPQMPGGFEATTPANIGVHVTNPGTFANNNFGYDDSGRIGDLIWNDTNGNGVRDGGEPGLDWQVTLTDSTGASFNQTAAAGAYSFLGLPSGNYTVTVSIPAGWAQTNVVEHPLLLNLAAGQTNNNADFGFSQTAASISGYVWYDPNRNGAWDPGENGINGINIVLRQGTGVVDTANTNANGYYFFGGLAAGNYQVDVDQADTDLGIRTLTTADPLNVPGVVAGQTYSNRNFGFGEPPAVTKPLYLSGTSSLTRVRPTGGAPRTATINNGNTATWSQTPALASPLSFVNNQIIVASVRIDSFRATGLFCEGEYPDVRATLRVVGGATIDTDTIYDMPAGSNTRVFNFDTPNYSIPQNATLALDLYVFGSGCGFGDGGYIIVYYDAASYLSRVDLPVYSYLQVDASNSGTYDAAYPGGAPSDAFLTADNVYFRLRASDPFGNADISGATISIPGVLAETPMTRYSPNPDNATAVYQLARSGFTLGSYTYVMTATEGTEGEVFAVHSGTFNVIISDLTDSFKEVRSWPARQVITETVPGAEIEYTVHISNTGAAPALNVSMIDPIPAHTTYIAGSVVNGVYSPTLNAIVWPGVTPTGTVPAASERVVTFRVQLDPVLDNSSIIENAAMINDGVNQFARNARTTIVAAPNLTASDKRVNRATAEPGDELLYTISLTNTGNMNASASLTDTVPVSTSLVAGSLSASSGNVAYNDGTRTVSWNGTVPGQNVNPGVVNVSFRVRVDSPLNNSTAITNTAYIDDGFAPNGTTTLPRQAATTITAEPLIQAYSSKIVDEQPTTTPGTTLHYHIYLANGGKMSAPNANLVDVIPAHTSYVAGSLRTNNIGTATWDSANNRITWVGPVNPGAPVEIHFNVRADSVLDNGTVITNTATVTDNFHPGSFDLQTATTIVSAPDLRTSSKTVSAGNAVPGQALNYQIHLINTGNMTATTRITDTLSPNLVNVRNVTPAGASYDAVGHAIVWAGPVGPGPEVTIGFTADVRNPLDGTQTIIYNTARVDDGFHAPFDLYPPTQTTVNASPDLSTSRKAVNRTTANPGDELLYTITLTNTGNMNTLASVQDLIPNQTTYVANSLSFSAGSGSYDPFNNWIQWEGPANPGTPVTISYTVTIAPVMNQPDTTIYNDARIDDGVHQPFLTPGVTTLVHAEPDLSTSTKVVDLNQAAPGQQLWYRITVRNSGRMIAHSASVSDTLPSQVNYVSGVFPTGGGYNATGRYIYWTGDVVPGTDVIIDYYVTVADPLDNGTIIANTAEIRDGYTGHASVVTSPAAQTTVNAAPNLSTSTKTVDKGTAAPGDVLNYTITLHNTGSMNGRNARITDTIPANTTYVLGSVTASSGSAAYDSGNNRITWTGTVTKGVPVVVTFRVQTLNPLNNGTVIHNVAQIDDGFQLPVLTRLADTIIGSAPNLQTSTKTVNRATAEPGDVLTYTIVLHNSGNQNAGNVSLSDVLPANVTYVAGSVTGGAAHDGTTLTWNGSIMAGARITVTYQVRVNLPLANNTLIENSATVNDGIHPAFDTPPAQTLIQSTPNLLTSDKTVDKETAAPGDTLVYTITLRNTGKMTAQNTSMYDILPSLVNIVGQPYASGGLVEYTSYNRRLAWSGSVSPLQPVTIIFTTTVHTPLDDGTQIVNNATIGDGIHSTFDTDPAITTISSHPDLATSTKSVNLAEAVPGAQLRYTIVLSNTGNMAAQGSVVDQLPDNVTYLSGPTASSGSGTWDGFNNRILWNGQVNPGTPVTIQYYVTVNNPTDNDTVITNTCDINDGFTATIYNPPAASTHITSAPNLSTSVKTVNKGTAAPGEELVYSITLNNTGNMNAVSASIADPIPANTTYVLNSVSASSGSASYDSGNNRIVWNGSVHRGTAVVVTFRVRLDTTLPNNTSIVNTATIEDGFVGHTPLSRQATTTVNSAPNLTTSTKTVDQTSAAPGDNLIYTITLVNNGNAVATGASLSDVLPGNVTFVGMVSAQGSYNGGSNSVTWTGDVTPGTPVVIQYRVAITNPLNNGLIIANTATVNDNFPGHTAFEAGPTQTTIQSAPNLSPSTKTVNTSTAGPGQVVTYTITLTNSGNMNASAYVVDNLPARTTYVAGSVLASVGLASYNSLQNRIDWNGTVPVGTAVTIRYAVQLDPVLDNGTLIWNTATVGDGVHSPFDTAPANTVVVAAPNLQPRTSKTVSSGTAVPGSTIRYTINLVNDGNMTAGNTQVVDVLPAEVSFVAGPFASSGSAIWDSFNNRVVWNGVVVPGTPVTIQYDVQVNNPLDDGTVIVNTATVNDNFPGHTAFEAGPASTTITAAPNLALSTKVVDQGTANPGARLRYTITLNNSGNMNATNVTVVDTLPPAYVTLVAPPPNATYDAGSGTLTWSGLAVNRNQPVVLTFDVDLAGAIPNGTSIVNTAVITDGFPGHTGLTRQATTVIGSAPNLQTSTKTVDQTSAAPDDLLVYTITLRNTGNAVASGARITDTLPANVSWDGWVSQNGAVLNGSTITWQGNVAPGANQVVAFRVRVNSPLDNNTVIANSATVSDGVAGHTPFTITSPDTVIHSAPDLTTSLKTVNLLDAAPGDELLYTITLANTGDMVAHNAIVLDEIPANTVISGNPTASSGSVLYQGAPYNRIRWTGDVTPGTEVVITFRVQVNSPLNNGTQITNFATMDDQVHQAFDTNTVVTTIHSAVNLTTSSKTVDIAEAVPGQTLHYIITLRNTGNMNAGGARITDTIPANTTYVAGTLSASSGVPVWDTVNRRITWSGEVPTNRNVTIEYYVTINSPLNDGTVITNTATMADGLNPAFETAPATQTLVRSAPDLSGSTKTVDRAVAAPGDAIEYTITLRNAGTMNAAGAVMTDTLPVEVDFINNSIVIVGGGTATYDPAQRLILWNGAVNAGQTVTIRYRARLHTDLTTGTLIENTATIDDGRLSVYDIGPAVTTVGHAVALSLNDERSTVQPGEFITYTILISGTDALGLGVTQIDIPNDTTLIEASQGYVQVGNDYIYWPFIQSQPNFMRQWYMVVQLLPVLDNNTIISTTAEVAGGGQSNRASESAIVVSRPNLTTSIKEVSNLGAKADEVVTYRIVLTNTGNMHAHTARITDVLPTAMTYETGPTVSGGLGGYSDGRLTWSGDVRVGTPVEIEFQARVNPDTPAGTEIVNTVEVDDGETQELLQRNATITVAVQAPARTTLYLPLILQASEEEPVEPGIELVIRNCSPDQDAVGAFWVDLYVNPDKNSIHWPISHGEGYDWFGQGASFTVSALGAGQSLKLRLSDAVLSDLPTPLPGNGLLYAQVDWVDGIPGKGVVDEGASGEANNVADHTGSVCSLTPGKPDLIVESIRVVTGSAQQVGPQSLPELPAGGQPAPARPQPVQK